MNFKVFLKSPILGHGISEAAYLYNIEGKNLLIAQTSTTVFYMAATGILGVLYTVMPIAAIIKNKGKGVLLKILIIFAFLMIINKEPHYRLALSYLFMFVCMRSGKQDAYNAKVS